MRGQFILNAFITLIVIAAVLGVAGLLYSANLEKIKFYTTGFDTGFKLGEIRILWKLARECKLENPIALYVSVPALNECITRIITVARSNNTEKSFKVQHFLTKLYKYRTRIALDKEGKRGLTDTHYLEDGQRMRVILPGRGVFATYLISNSHELIVALPYRKNKNNNGFTVIDGKEWEGKGISVYLWRDGDACYAFDSIVFSSGEYKGKKCLFILHSDKLDRAQKRQSVRCKCEIYAQMYLIRSEVVDYNVVDQDPGYKCLLEDISEDGALIRIGGKGKVNARIKLQFTISESFVMMYGVIRGVEYNKNLDQSRLHFECTHIDPAMKNAVLTYVYNVAPQDVKDINEAIMQTESDSIADAAELEPGEEELEAGDTVTPEAADAPVVPKAAAESSAVASLSAGVAEDAGKKADSAGSAENKDTASSASAAPVPDPAGESKS